MAVAVAEGASGVVLHCWQQPTNVMIAIVVTMLKAKTVFGNFIVKSPW
jgi:hypothetical protein